MAHRAGVLLSKGQLYREDVTLPGPRHPSG
jgi:hypothetical protein